MKKFRKLWDTLEDTKRIKFILQSTDALKKYEEEVRRLKEQHPEAADHIPDTVNALTKADLAIYDSHQGGPSGAYADIFHRPTDGPIK